MKRWAKVLFILASVAYPFLVLGGLWLLHAPTRLLALSLLIIVVLNFLANSGEAKVGGFPALRFWAVTGLLTLMVVLIVITDSLGIVKIYPVLVNIFLLASFGWTLWKGPVMIYRFAVRQDASIPDSPDQPKIMAYCRTVTLVWCGFFTLNAAAATYTAFWCSEAVWTLYNGLISYCLIGALLGGEFLFRLWWNKR